MAEDRSHCRTDRDELSTRAERIYDACMRAVKVLEFNREPRSEMPGRYVQAALREVEELRVSQRRSENADVGSDSVTLYCDGMQRPEKVQWDAVFGKPIRPTDSNGAIDRLLMLAHWLRCNCVFPLKLTVPWHEEPDWIELRKQTRRLFNAVSGALRAIRGPLPQDIAAYADEIAFRVEQLWYPFTSDPHTVQALSWCHVSGLVCCGEYEELFASRIVLHIGMILNEGLLECRDEILEGDEQWMRPEDRALLEDCHINDDCTFWRHSPERIKSHWKTLQACAEQMPTPTELKKLKTKLNGEFIQVQNPERQEKRIPPARFVHMPWPWDLGFIEPEESHDSATVEPSENGEPAEDGQDPCIIAHGNGQYSIGGQVPVAVTNTEHYVLDAFLHSGRSAMFKPDLEKKSGVQDAVRYLRRLRDKYDRIFADAIILPGGRGRGGYRVSIKSAE